MQDLTLVGLSEDGTRLVLASVTGEEFAVPVDTRLRAALRGETTARDRQWETKMDSALRPRDIQARIRAGETPEDVAAAARTTVEAIMPFAGPVIAERQHVASNALKGSLRRRTGETTTAARTLGEAAELFFSHHSLHDEDVEWDAWRRPDGRWALVATYELGGRPRSAEFTHDQPGRYVVAENDEAKVLTGELALPGQAGPPAGRAGGLRSLSPVPTQDELPLGDDAIELVRDPEPAREQSPAQSPVAAEDRAEEAVMDPVMDPAMEPGADTADADWLAGPPRPTDQDVPLLEEPAGTEASQDTDATEVAGAGATTEGREGAETTEEVAEDGPAEDPSSTGTGEPARTEKSSRRKGRSSVPSWDEIMFGGSARED